MNINLSDIRWEDIASDETLPRSRLLGAVQFNGVNHHLEAIEVQNGESKFDQNAASVLCDDILKRYDAIDSDGGPFNTVLIDDRTYALFITPFPH
jgi:hypothetical protein